MIPKSQIVLAAALLLAGVVSAFADRIDPYFALIISNIGINVILAVSLNLINGYTGQFSLGHAGFMSVGAYLAAAGSVFAGPKFLGEGGGSALQQGGLFLAALLAAPFAPTAPVASAEGTFTFYGSGYGHGIGMSQWGAYGLAKAGWAAEAIATYYYAGTEISTLGDTDPIRVGLANGRASFSFTAQGGPVSVTVGGAEIGQIPDGSTWSVVPDGTAFDVLDATGVPVGPAVGDASTPVVIVPGDARVRVPELGRTYGRGQLEVGLHLCAATCKERLVAVVPIEQYLYGIAEVANTWPAEALKAQAIVARTYAITKATVSQHRSPCDCAVYASTVDQVYVGMDKETSTGGANWVAAVDATVGEVVTYQGATIQAFYMTSSGGYTEDNDKAWGGVAIPYLRGVCDPGDFVAANPSAAWTVTLSATDVSTKLNLNVGTVTGFSVVSRGVSGRILSVTVTGDRRLEPNETFGGVTVATAPSSTSTAGTTGTASLTVANGAVFVVGMPITGTGIAAGTTVRLAGAEWGVEEALRRVEEALRVG